MAMSDQSTAAQIVYKENSKFPGYRFGEDGSIWSRWRFSGKPICTHVIGDKWKPLKPGLRPKDNRKRYTLRGADGYYRRAYGSFFILEAFIGPAPDGLEACHENGNCTDDSAGNLRWDTHSANLLDRRAHGTAPCGEQINTAKLTAEIVVEIRRIGKPLKQHAQKYGVSEALVSAIIKRKVWQHV
jgi:hypothetical protein